MDYLEKLKPKCILAFGTRKDLFNYTRLGIIFDDSLKATWLKNKKLSNATI